MFIWLSRFELYTNRDNPINLYNAHSANKLINFNFTLAKVEVYKYSYLRNCLNLLRKKYYIRIFREF